MYTLVSNEIKCGRCGTCERLIRGFKTQYNGCLMISMNRYHNEEEIRCSCESLIDACPNEAIKLENIK